MDFYLLGKKTKMESVILVIHLILALAIVVLVLLQRSEGGGLGIGGGGGLGQFASARDTANALTKATAFCACLFFVTSMSLTYLAGSDESERGLLEKYSEELSEPPSEDGESISIPEVPIGDSDSSEKTEKNNIGSRNTNQSSEVKTNENDNTTNQLKTSTANSGD